MTKEYIQDDGQLRVFIVPVDILDVPDLTSSEKLVYIVLRSYVNPTDPTAFPSYETIAKKASLKRRRTIDIVKSLVEKGLIRKEIRLDVSKNRKIRNTSNMYTLVTPKKKPSATIAPPLVQPLHSPSANIAPYHNHLTEPLISMIDCMGASAETAAASESSISESESNEIIEALNEHVPAYCFVQGIPLGSAYITEIYLMLVNQFSNMLSAEVVRIAAERYFDRACKTVPGKGIVMKLNVQNPTGLFQDCYKDALKLWKLQR